MDTKAVTRLGGTITKIAVGYNRKLSDGDFGSVGGEFFVEMNLPPDADANLEADALFAWTKEAAVRNLKASLEAVRPKESGARSLPQAAPSGPQGDLGAENEPRPRPPAVAASAPAPVQGAPEGTERVLDIQADDTVQLGVNDRSGKKYLIFKVGPFKTWGIKCWPEVVHTWSELADWETWQVAALKPVSDFGIRSIVFVEKQSKTTGEMTPDKVVAFR